MTPINITYRIKLDEKTTEVFEFVLDGESGDLVTETPVNPPAWTALDFRQCSHCPLQKAEYSHCPIALQLYKIIERFHNTSSIDEVELEVITEERRILQTLPLQRAIGSMLGLVSPTCGCPKMAYMKPMARFHLPLASEEETLFRVAGMYLLSQHLLAETVVDFSGLKMIYEDLHILNKALATRLRGATESDSSKNAIALLDMYSNLVPMMIDDQLPELKNLFSAYELRTGKPEAAMPAMEEPVQETGKPAEIKIKEKTADDLALEALLQEVSSDELAELLGTQQDVVVKKPLAENNPGEKPKGRAVFKIADD